MRVDRKSVIGGVVLAVAYAATARLGFSLATVAEQVTTVWPPTGIAQAGLLLGGIGLWPAVWIGAFVANASTQAPVWTAAGIATGNTLEACATAWALSRLPGFDPGMRRTRDVVAFILVAAVASPLISSTIGVATLCAAGVEPWHRFESLWGAWTLGDALGALVVAPAILTLARAWPRLPEWRVAETVALLLLTLAVTDAVFGEFLPLATGAHPLEFAVFPIVIAAAVRLGQPATSLVVLCASVVSIWNTAQGIGPFGNEPLDQRLVLLQVFMGVLSGSALVLAAAIAERQLAERRRAAAHAVGEVLAGAAGLDEAAPKLLEALCRHLDCQIGGLWTIDRAELRCRSLWGRTDRSARFLQTTRAIRFPKGAGLPGRVWASGQPAWIEDVLADPDFSRQAEAREAGIRVAFAFPVCLGRDVLGVVEFYRRRVAAPDADLSATMAAVGTQIGQFIVRKQIEHAMRGSDTRTRAIIESALDAVVTIDHQGLITEFNPAAERTFGYRRHEALGRELADLVLPARHRAAHRQGLVRYLATGDGPFLGQRIETTAVHADGREFPVEISISAAPTDGPPMFTGFIRDVTDRARAEHERRELLERERAARREAEIANRAKDEFLATLSHEIRTPLNAIVGWTRMLLDGTVDPSHSRRALEAIDRNAHAQVQLVADLLDVSRIITGGLKLEIQTVDLESVIGAALDAVRPAANAKQIAISTSYAASARTTEADPTRLQQVVWNLLANAVKFTPQGGRIQVDLQDDGDHVSIRVRDSGPGIAPEFLPYVFERFRQADGSFSRRHGGLGLGLAIVRHLVELHGGTVRAEAGGDGAGATFLVELPRAAADARETAITAREA